MLVILQVQDTMDVPLAILTVQVLLWNVVFLGISSILTPL